MASCGGQSGAGDRHAGPASSPHGPPLNPPLTEDGPQGPTKGPDQRTFSVARPIMARISEMIQKRITMVDSAQPFFS